MGGRDSSSKRKSSKRKRDKTSPKKKSRGKGPKKRRHSYDSVTSYTTDDTLNSENSSSSTSESDYRRRVNKNKKRHHDSSVSSYSSDSDSYDNGYKNRKAQRSQVGLKDSKRRARKTFTSPNGDIDVHSVWKKKRLVKDRVVKPIKKSTKKKSRKHLSSSSSSDSESCSACQSRSSSDTADGKNQRSKVILRKERESRKGRQSDKGKKKPKERSPRFSSCDRGSDPSVDVSNDDVALSPVNNSRRLRSVIAVVDQPHDEGENRWEMDPHKEELVYDQNDYPSPKSMRSNEGGSRMESGNHSHGPLNNRICVENFAGEEVPKLGKTETDESDQNKAGDPRSVGSHMNDFEKEKEVVLSAPDAALGGDALESILRQKALENLRRRRLQTGPRSTISKMNNESDVDNSFTGTVDNDQSKSIVEGSSNAQEMDKRSGLSLKRDFPLITEVKKLPDAEPVAKVPGMARQSVALPPNGAALLECSEEEIPAISRTVLAEPISRSDTGPGTAGTNACSSTVEPCSSIAPMSGEHSLEQGNEAKDGSQFEQKTMSVMRGGEMVQVSYKVYIPKKAPALARRQLMR